MIIYYLFFLQFIFVIHISSDIITFPNDFGPNLIRCPRFHQMREHRLLQKVFCDTSNATLQKCCPDFMKLSEAPPHTKVSEICGFGGSYDRFIYKDNEAPIDAYPWMVLLGFKSQKTQLITFECSGALISDRHILTSAKCALKIKTTRKKRGVARFREWDIRTTPDCIETRVANICFPEHFDVEITKLMIHKNSKSNDIAIVSIENPINFQSILKTVRPICLPPKNITVETLRRRGLIMSGWGTASLQKEIENHFNVLHHAYVQLSSSSLNCSLKQETCCYEAQNEICVNKPEKYNQTIGDLGGPLIATSEYGPPYFIIGVGSRGNLDDPTETSSAIFTSALYYLDWIQKTIEYIGN